MDSTEFKIFFFVLNLKLKIIKKINLKGKYQFQFSLNSSNFLYTVKPLKSYPIFSFFNWYLNQINQLIYVLVLILRICTRKQFPIVLALNELRTVDQMQIFISMKMFIFYKVNIFCSKLFYCPEFINQVKQLRSSDFY